MRPDIEKWYVSKNLPIDRIIDIGMKRQKIKDKEVILDAIESDYERRINPENSHLKDIEIAWDVWKRARETISAGRVAKAIEKYNKEKKTIEDLQIELEKVTSDYDDLKETFESQLEDLLQKAKNEAQKTLNRYFLEAVLLYFLTVGGLFALYFWKTGAF